MLAVEYSMKEFFNSVSMVRWEWLLATIIVVGKMLASRLSLQRPESSFTKPRTHNPEP